MSEFVEPLAVVDNDGVHINTVEIQEKLERKNLSPSLITGLEKCAASWVADSMILKEFIEPPVDNPAVRGNLFHKIMEIFFALPAEERTKDRIKEIAAETINSEEFEQLKAIPEVKIWLQKAIGSYYAMGAKPEQVKVASFTNEDGEEKIGLEMFVKGKLGDTKRDILGFIDRLVLDPRFDDHLIIEDWKTGAKAKKWNPKTKSNEGEAEARQQVIYSELLKSKGMNVTGARLLYPVARTVVPVDLTDKTFNKKVLDSVIKTDEQLDGFIEDNSFPYSPSHLCAWCPLVNICPKGTIKPYQKMLDAAKTQPRPEDLMVGIEIR